ncbi:AAA family ATPase [Sulfuriflexus mobilis]|uniref:AAA family ATPase n=1 Tax=Sulfuriflexus mobilis TaxID=1811807 RepID=UPI000F82FFFC|nr:AAA family ATPase [Sulfuriflexus mobilis]
MNGSANQYTDNGLAPYLSKLGLSIEPFSDSVEEDFFLLGSSRSQLLNMLYHLAQNSELLLVVSGVTGSGKTSLLQHFIDMGDESWRSCVIDANAMLNPEQLLIQIAEGFGLPQDSVNFGSGLDMLKKRLIEMKRSELISMLIIDDAHELPAASLTLLMKLSELSDANEGLLRIVLFSEPQLTAILNASSLKDVRYRVTHTLDMPPLNEAETSDYIHHRLAVAGLQSGFPFSKSQLKKIYRQSGGIPGKINLYAHEILLGTKPAGNRSDTKINAASQLRSFVLVLLILVITGGVTWVFTRDAFNKLYEHLTSPVGPEDTIVTAEEKKDLDLPLLPAKPISPAESPAAAGAPGDSSKAGAAPTNAYALRQPDIQTQPIDKISPAIEATQPPARSETIDEATAADKAVAAADRVKPQPPTPSPVTNADTAPKPVVKKAVTVDWLAQQNPNYYTLQIMGSRERDAVARVLQDYKLGKQAAIIKTRHKGTLWYILVYGAYSGPQVAKSHIRDLPPRLTSLVTPWPRKIGEIKQVK